MKGIRGKNAVDRYSRHTEKDDGGVEEGLKDRPGLTLGLHLDSCLCVCAELGVL